MAVWYMVIANEWQGKFICFECVPEPLYMQKEGLTCKFKILLAELTDGWMLLVCMFSCVFSVVL